MFWVRERPAVQRPSMHGLPGILMVLKSSGFAMHRRGSDGLGPIVRDDEPSREKSGPCGVADAGHRRACRAYDYDIPPPCEAATTSTGTRPARVRTLFLSDMHLGTRGCQAELLSDFLQHYEASTIYLVGDIVETWRLTSARPWSEQHRDVVLELLTKARHGARVIYVPGNHDRLLRQYAGCSFAGIEIATGALHEAADGQRYLVTHGDEFDAVLRHMPWLAALGHITYHALLGLNTTLNMIRRSFGLGHWSLSAWAKHKVKRAVSYISCFEESLSAEARRQDAQGVVCGHIHHAADHDLGGIRYLNTGDWVESCSGIVEHEDGRFELVRWTGMAPTRRPDHGMLRARLHRGCRPPDRTPVAARDGSGRA